MNNWRTSPFVKEKLQRLKNAFTQRAIKITSCIGDADKKRKETSTKRKEIKRQEDEHEQELGEYINHAGRLLLNHGYIEDAIKTQNKTYLDNTSVKDILNEMWYGTEKLDSRTILTFIALAAVHIIMLPLLLINMETRPLLWFYKKYKLPFMKVFTNMLGFLALLTAYAYMLLFDYSDEGITNTDCFIIIWMASFFVDENKQLIVAIIRGKWKMYISDWWNRLDWLSMFRDTFSFMIIMTVIMMSYNISFYALLYPNSELSWLQMEKIIKNGYWMLFGELNLDGDTLSEPDCTFNRTIYESGAEQRCPTELGVYLTPYLKATYGLIAVILLLNLLIAMYSHTFQKVQQESEFYWSELQTNFLEEYSIKTVFPIHLQLLVLPAAIIHALLWFCYSKRQLYGKCYNNDISNNLDDEFGEEAILNHRPMFVRVFLYNTNFDLKLKTTKEAEGNGALKAKGEMDLMEVDRITMLQRQLDANSKNQDKQNEKNDRRYQKLSRIAKSIKEEEEVVVEKEVKHVLNSSSSDENDSDSLSISSDEYSTDE